MASALGSATPADGEEAKSVSAGGVQSAAFLHKALWIARSVHPLPVVFFLKDAEKLFVAGGGKKAKAKGQTNKGGFDVAALRDAIFKHFAGVGSLVL